MERFICTTDLGNSWQLVYNVPPLTIMGIVIDDSNHIYANQWNDRLMSTDNGNSWASISGPQLEQLFIDKYHRIYSGPLGHRSLDNCVSWTLIGPTSPSWVHTYTFVDSLIFAEYNRWCLFARSFLSTLYRKRLFPTCYWK